MTAHIDFDIHDWLANEGNDLMLAAISQQLFRVEDKSYAALNALVNAIKAADRVCCGWTVIDAEKVRTDEYSDRVDLSLEDSYAVIETVQDNWDASLGCTWDDIEAAYQEYVEVLDARTENTVAETP